MATLSDYTSGTISLANGSVTVTGTGTLFEVTRFREGDTLQIQNLTAVIASVDSDTQLTLTEPWTGTTIVDGPYRARQLGDGSRVSTQAATVIQTLGNGVLTNLAELGVEEGKTPVGGPTGEYELVDYIADPNGSLGKLAALAFVANKAITTNGSGNAQQSDLGALGSSLLATQNAEAARAVIGASRPAFRAFYPSNAALANGEYFMTIPSTSLNVGNVWNGSQMVCNEAGIYRFECNFVTAGGTANTGTIVAEIDVNTSTIGSSAKSKDNWFDPIYASTVARLNVGDIVRFKLSLTGLSGSVEMLANRSYATGVLIG